MKTLIFASNNAHKLGEIRNLLDNIIEIQSLKDINLEGDIPETSNTLEGNATQKAEWIYSRIGQDCFADDTGLEVEALDGAPGVYSARYAGEGCSFADNVNKLLKAMKGQSNRKARFRTVICLIENNEKHYFEGIVNGTIVEKSSGNMGFGYDPIFFVKEKNKGMAELEKEEKAIVSHRAKALNKVLNWLKNEYIKNQNK